ncbi:MAG: hypothetical protein D6730_09865 [Bacteroidetes bacterium]|nr:MAG: hypothetical protein D6730_09865 [Bacteroidota bacterium]
MLSSLSQHELVQFCNEKLVCAARDLAEFTKRGIHASHIVDLAHQCEQLEHMLHQPKRLYKQADVKALEKELVSSTLKLCETGRNIWKHDKSKYKDYEVAYRQEAVEDLFPRPGMNVA